MRTSARFFSIGLLLMFANTSAFGQIGTPVGVQVGQTYHTIFASSVEVGVSTNDDIGQFDIGGFNSADWFVTFGAFNSASGGTGLPFSGGFENWNGTDLVYRALVSIPGTNAVDRLMINGPIYNTANQLVATDELEFFTTNLTNPVGFDEFGMAITTNSLVWTATNSGGSSNSMSCSGWTNQSSGDFGLVGDATVADIRWISDGGRQCNLTAHLYGLSPDIVAAAITPQSMGLVPRPDSDLVPIGGAALAGEFNFQSLQANFTNVSCCHWVAAGTTAAGYVFEANDGGQFTEILNFSEGFTEPFTVFAEGQNLGSFTVDDQLDFVTLLGHGVDSFAIISGNGRAAFPIHLAFGPTGGFTVQGLDAVTVVAVPEPSSVWLFALLFIISIVTAKIENAHLSVTRYSSRRPKRRRNLPSEGRFLVRIDS